MSQNSSIEWTEKTWNPIRGCTKVSPGCAHCYAETFAERWRGIPGHAYEQGFDLRLVPEKLDEPLRQKKPTTYFVNSMSDLFQDGVPDEYIDRVFAVMALAPQHTFQVLTKRAERMLDYFIQERHRGHLTEALAELYLSQPSIARIRPLTDEVAEALSWPLPNVWLGVSVENQHFADERIPLLLRTPAAVRFISAEPLLGPIDLTGGDDPLKTWLRNGITALRGLLTDEWVPPLDWVIVGGESGPGARLFDYEWARSIIQQCKAATVPVFMKQVGALPIDSSADGLSGLRFLKSKKGNDMSEWPEDLRIREMPTGQR
jgi:protein gp37